MDGKQYIKKTYSVSWNSLSEVKAWLEEMAGKGYKLVEVKGGSRFLFEKTAPKKIHYAVEVLPNGSSFDTHPSQKSEEYIYFCENVGWNYVDSTGNIYFFSSEKEEVVEIETDEKLKFQTVKKAVFRGKVIPSICCVILACFSLYMDFTLNYYSVMLSPVRVETVFLWLLVMGLHLYNLIRYCLWVNRAKRIVNDGGKMPEEKKMPYWLCIAMLVIFAVIHSAVSVVLSVKYSDVIGYVVPLIWGVIFVTVFFSKWMTIYAEKNKIGREGNMILQLVALPIICTMLIGVVSIGIITTEAEDRSEILIGKEEAAVLCPSKGAVEYEVNSSSYGNFILALDRVFITAYSQDGSEMDTCHMAIYRSDRKQVLNRLLRDANKFRTHSIYFDMDSADRREEEDVIIYESKFEKGTYEYLLCDSDTILCLYGWREPLSEEQFMYFRETILNK